MKNDKIVENREINIWRALIYLDVSIARQVIQIKVVKKLLKESSDPDSILKHWLKAFITKVRTNNHFQLSLSAINFPVPQCLRLGNCGISKSKVNSHRHTLKLISHINFCGNKKSNNNNFWLEWGVCE